MNMKKKSWHISRRELLRSATVCIALPWLEAMGVDQKSQPSGPARFFAGYFPYGVPTPSNDSPERLKNGWFPVGTGSSYEVPDMHKHFTPIRDKVTFFSGLSHPAMRKTSSHKCADPFLTGANLGEDYENQSISIDQFIADKIGHKTRYPSLVTSSMGGFNRPSMSSTMSFDRDGRPVPALNKPAEIFRRLFGPVTEYEKKNLASRGSIIDNVLEEAKSLNTRLGKNDRSKMDEYLTSVRDVEKDVQRSTEWMNIPKANLDENMFALDAQPTDPRKYLKVMYDLIALAFQTDTLRVATFQTGDERSYGVANNFPVALGFSKDAHGLSHADNFDEPALYISALNEIYSDFLKKLNSFQEGDATVLDNTIAMYGSGGSIVHVAVNYPLILSGGQNLGFKHGFHHKYSEDIHLTNLFVTIANRLSVTTKGFADSTGFLQV